MLDRIPTALKLYFAGIRKKQIVTLHLLRVIIQFRLKTTDLEARH